MIKRMKVITAFALLFVINVNAEMDLLIDFVKQKQIGAAEPQQSNFNYIEFPSRDVDLYMMVAGENSGMPESVQGLWWMDGNPLPDEVVSFGASTWNSWLNSTTVDVYAPGVWTWHTSNAGFSLFSGALHTKLTYFFKFNDDINFARITPIVDINGFVFPIPRFVADFTMTYVKDGEWIRETKFFGRESDSYRLRRIVRGNGEREELFNEFLDNAPELLFMPLN